jgi:hypothetical protein
VSSGAGAATRRLGVALATAAGVAALLAGAFFLAKGRDVQHERLPSTDVLLESTVDVPADGTAVRVRVRKPGRLEFAVRASIAVEVEFGVPKPPPREGGTPATDGPTDESRKRWTATPGDPPHEEFVLADGMYVVRLASFAPTSATLAVRWKPER